MDPPKTETKICKQCDKIKQNSELMPPKKRKGGILVYGVCIICNKENNRRSRIKKWFNISLEEYEQVLIFQERVCAICKKPPKNGKNLAVDHDHKSGLIRGLLCSFCNRSIAIFRDNAQKLENAVIYLKSPPVTLALGAPRYGLKGRVSNKAATVRRLNKPT